MFILFAMIYLLGWYTIPVLFVIWCAYVVFLLINGGYNENC